MQINAEFFLIKQRAYYYYYYYDYQIQEGKKHTHEIIFLLSIFIHIYIKVYKDILQISKQRINHN
jgi:hypothetical protein